MDGSAPDGAGGGGGYRGVSELGDRRRKALFRVKMLSPLFHGGGVLQREDLRARRGGATGCGQASQEKRRKVAHFDDRDVVHTLLQGCVSWDDNVVREALNQVSTKMLSEYISSREMFDAVHTAEVLFTPLLFACIHGNCGAVKELVARGAPLEKGVVGNSVTPLYAAAHYGHEDIVKVLCAAGALVNASQSDGASVLYAACKQGHLDTVRLLKQYNANVNICKSNGVTSLHVAAQNGHWQVCSFLIKVMGMDVHKCSDTGSTPLHLAVFQKREMVVRTLLENGADVDATDEWGWTPLHVAAQAGNTNIIHLLVVSPVVPKSTLHVEAKTISEDLLTHWGGCKDKSGPLQGVDWSSCDLKELRTDAICLLRLNRRKKDEYTPLMVACRSGADVSAAQYLLDMGANPRMKLSDGITPLMIAAKQGHLVYVQMLSKCLSRNDFLAHTTVQMWNALHWAAKGGRVSVVRFLLSLKDEKTIFTPDIQNQNMMTPLYIACHHGNLEVVKCLVEEFGADTNRMIGQHAITPLYTACKHGHVNVVRYLYGRSSTIRPSSSLFTAAKYDRVRVARFLVEEADLDPLEERNAQGWTPIHSAARAGATKVLDYFVNRLGASAVVCCKTETIQQAAGLREQAEEGDRLFGKYTPLHLAASNGRMGAVRYLVGPPVWADLEELSTRGHTAEMVGTFFFVFNVYLSRAFVCTACSYGRILCCIGLAPSCQGVVVVTLLRRHKPDRQDQRAVISRRGCGPLSSSPNKNIWRCSIDYRVPCGTRK
mmetsp:Transcript_7975/g.14630  ORF Transcript_7975/g.14630 Transcript_7975/m.14630 type:complete len:770 (+) Transcript_7975:256-2565(+)